MNNEEKKTKVMREVLAEWDEVMRLASQIPFGEIRIKVLDRKIQLVEYVVKRKNDEIDEFEVFAI